MAGTRQEPPGEPAHTCMESQHTILPLVIYPPGVYTQAMEQEKKRLIDRDPAEKQALIRRLHRIIGQLEGIERMIEEDRWCGEILNQTAAAQKALQSVGYQLLDSHMRSCVALRLREGDEEVLEEVSSLVRKLK